MARINVEATLNGDARFQNLIIKFQCPDRALGAVIRAWQLAQKHYLTSGVIPFDEWEAQGCRNELIDVGLAEKRENGIYMKGSSKQFQWLKQKSEAGKIPKKRIKRDLTGPNGTQRDESSFLLSPSSFSSSSSFNISAHFEKCASELYSLYPKKIGKKAGWVKMKRILKTENDFERLKASITNYIALCKKRETEFKFIKQFDTFLTTWEDWLDPLTGTGADFKKQVHYLSEEETSEA